MATYRVVNKAHIRATFREQPAVDARGNPYVIIHAGEPIRLEVGTFVQDLTPEELKAFPDRFQLVPEELVPRGRAHAAHEPAASAEPESTTESTAGAETPSAASRETSTEEHTSETHHRGRRG